MCRKMSRLRMVRSCAEPGCNYVTDRAFNLRRHEEEVHHKQARQDTELYEDDLFQMSSDDEDHLTNAQRSGTVRSTVSKVKHEELDETTQKYQDAGDWIFGLGPAATTATLVRELMVEFAFTREVAEAVAVTSRTVATGVASLTREVDMMTRSSRPSGYVRRIRSALESWARPPNWMAEIEGEEVEPRMETKESQTRGKKRFNTDLDQSSGSDKTEEKGEEVQGKQEVISQKEESRVGFEMDQESMNTEEMTAGVGLFLPRPGVSPTVSRAVSPAVTPLASPMADSTLSKTITADSPAMPTLTKEIMGPTLDSNNNTTVASANSFSIVDFQKMPGFSAFIEQMHASFMAEVSGSKKKGKKKARRSTQLDELQSVATDKTSSKQDTVITPPAVVSIQPVELTELHQLGRVEDQDWSPVPCSTVTTDAPVSTVADRPIPSIARMPGPQPAWNRSTIPSSMTTQECYQERIPRLFVYLAKYRGMWDIEVADTTKVLVIGDSNMKSAFEIPVGWEVHSLSGGRMDDVTSLLRRMVLGKQLEVIIVQVGINHRDTGFPHEEIKLLRQIVEQMRVRLMVQGISISPRLPEAMQKKLMEYNETLHKIFAANYIFPQRDRKVGLDPTDSSLVHYDVATMQRQINSMFNRLKDLNFARASASTEARPSVTPSRPRTLGDGGARC